MIFSKARTAYFPTRPLAPFEMTTPYFVLFYLIGRLDEQQLEIIRRRHHRTHHHHCLLSQRSEGARTEPTAKSVSSCPWWRETNAEVIELAINLILYSLTSNYNLDVAHVAELFEREDYDVFNRCTDGGCSVGLEHLKQQSFRNLALIVALSGLYWTCQTAHQYLKLEMVWLSRTCAEGPYSTHSTLTVAAR